MVEQTHADIDETIVEAMLALAGERGWHNVSLQDVADRSGLSLVEIYDRAPGRTGLLQLLQRHAAQALTAQLAPADPQLTERDRLFDVIMLSLEYWEPHRNAVESIYRSLVRDPVTALIVARIGWSAVDVIYDAAELPWRGPGRAVAQKMIAAIWLNAFRTWLDDDGAELAKTMAVLDRDLRRLESLADRLKNCPLGTFAGRLQNISRAV